MYFLAWFIVYKMLVEIKSLWGIYLKYKQNNLPLVLATIVNTTGSSYKKTGAMMLIEPNKTTHGMLSGGCLEKDLAEHAEDVFDSKQAKKVTYDLSDDSIFGLGAGCQGSIDVVLQIINDEYFPFSALNPNPKESSEVKLIIQASENKEFPNYGLGSYSFIKNNVVTEFPDGFDSFAKKMNYPEITYCQPPKVAIFGAGLGSLPLCQLIDSVYWHGCSIDYRESLLQIKQFPNQWQLIHAKRSELTCVCEDQEFDAVIIMSHNINNDAHFLKSAYESDISFIGLLGSKQRRDKVLQKAGIKLSEIKDRLKAPVGLNIGGNLPENIAVSIVAELQRYFFK